MFLALGIIVVKNEHHRKVACGYEFTEGDLKATPKNLAHMIIISFFGSMAAAFCGIGPGFIFAPLLVMIGMEPTVATSTGMYVTMFTTLSSSIQVIIFKKIEL